MLGSRAESARSTNIRFAQMTVFKLIGCALVMVAGLGLCTRLNKEEEKKQEQTVALTALLRFFRTQIDLYCVPVAEIFRRCDSELLRACGCSCVPSDFSGFLAVLDPPPEKKLLEELYAFAAELGSSYKDEQLKILDYHITKMSEICENEERALRKKIKLNTTLCLSAAALIVILLI